MSPSRTPTTRKYLKSAFISEANKTGIGGKPRTFCPFRRFWGSLCWSADWHYGGCFPIRGQRGGLVGWSPAREDETHKTPSDCKLKEYDIMPTASQRYEFQNMTHHIGPSRQMSVFLCITWAISWARAGRLVIKLVIFSPAQLIAQVMPDARTLAPPRQRRWRGRGEKVTSPEDHIWRV